MDNKKKYTNSEKILINYFFMKKFFIKIFQEKSITSAIIEVNPYKIWLYIYIKILHINIINAFRNKRFL